VVSAASPQAVCTGVPGRGGGAQKVSQGACSLAGEGTLTAPLQGEGLLRSAAQSPARYVQAQLPAGG